MLIAQGSEKNITRLDFSFPHPLSPSPYLRLSRRWGKIAPLSEKIFPLLSSQQSFRFISLNLSASDGARQRASSAILDNRPSSTTNPQSLIASPPQRTIISDPHHQRLSSSAILTSSKRTVVFSGSDLGFISTLWDWPQLL